MEITLLIDGKEKTFTAPFVSTRKLKDTLKLSEKVAAGFTSEVVDETAEYMCDIYGHKFTSDELLDGYPAQKYFSKVLEDMSAIINGFNEAVKN